MRFATHILGLGLLCQAMVFGAAINAAAQTSAQTSGQTSPETNEATQRALEFLKATPVQPQISKPEILEDEFFKADYIDLTLPIEKPQARMQKGQRVTNLKTLKGLEIKHFARRLGQVSAIARGTEGQLYTADRKSGRIFIIPDSDQNGRPEQIRRLPYRFNEPSAVVESGGFIYVADREAIWKLSKSRIVGQAPQVLANLMNTGSTGRYFLVAQNSTSNAPANLSLGYTSQAGKARIVSVDTVTGQAQLLDETDGELLQFAAVSGAKPWLTFRNQSGLQIGTSFDDATPLGQSLTLTGMALPNSQTTHEDWPKSLRDHVIISRANPVTVTALPTSLGTALPRGRDIFTGFQDGRTAWGRAGALHMDRRGLFIADPYNGELWLVKPKDKAAKNGPKDKVQIALDKFRAASKQDENPLKRDPLDSVQRTFFPDSNTPSESAASSGVKDKVKSPKKPPL